mmetsp:Transcript_25467/g.64682  ORF Transcript_25467/g.64682 Transcript_25467/m.64682 type:complete len:320 (-) Transcript_25467:712-1671(-)
MGRAMLCRCSTEAAHAKGLGEEGLQSLDRYGTRHLTGLLQEPQLPRAIPLRDAERPDKGPVLAGAGGRRAKKGPSGAVGNVGVLNPWPIWQFDEVPRSQVEQPRHEVQAALYVRKAVCRILVGGDVVDVMYDREREQDVADGCAEGGEGADPSVIPHLGRNDAIRQRQLPNPAQVRLNGLGLNDLILRSRDAGGSVADAHRSLHTDDRGIGVADRGLHREEAAATAQVQHREVALQTKGLLQFNVHGRPSSDEVGPRPLDVRELRLRQRHGQPRLRGRAVRGGRPDAASTRRLRGPRPSPLLQLLLLLLRLLLLLQLSR